jgi:hypothetical protein
MVVEILGSSLIRPGVDPLFDRSYRRNRSLIVTQSLLYLIIIIIYKKIPKVIFAQFLADVLKVDACNAFKLDFSALMPLFNYYYVRIPQPPLEFFLSF